MSTTNNLSDQSSIEDLLKEAFRLLKIAEKKTGVNLIDNYSYREFTTIEQLRELLPSIKKQIGRTGDDATAVNEDYHHIEQKSGTNKHKTLTMNCFPSMMFDKQNDSVRREYIYNYDGISLSYFEYYEPYPTAVVFVSRDHVKKLHPLMRQRQQEKIVQFEQRIAEGKNIGRDAITIGINDLLEYVGKENLICWLRGQRITSDTFFNMIEQGEIKINQ
jgi:hypothetical protein